VWADATNVDSAPEPRFMERAIALAIEGVQREAGGPFGAVVVLNGEVIGEAHNEVLSLRDPTAHAEVGAIRAASRHLQSFHLTGAELYASCEPCPMCLAAAQWAHIDRIWYAGTRADAARAGFDDDHFHTEFALPPAERQMPAHEFLRSAAQPAFEAWLAQPDRTAY
jgi:tRNA(Arg) A34 adenosine deaminase TadA